MNSVLRSYNPTAFGSLTHLPPSVVDHKSPDVADTPHDPSWESSISSLLSNCSDPQTPSMPLDLDQSMSLDNAMEDLDMFLSPSAESAISPHLYPFISFSDDLKPAVDSFDSFPFSLEGFPFETNISMQQHQQEWGFHSASLHPEGSQEQVSDISVSEQLQENLLHMRTSAASAKPPLGPRRRAGKTSEEIARTRVAIRRARAARNRASARRSRLRKKAECQRDMERAISVQEQNESLKRRVAELRDKADNLRKVAVALGLTNELQQSEEESVNGSITKLPVIEE